MVYVLDRNLQGINVLLSSWAIILLIVGFIVEEWVELVPKTKKNKIIHNPWRTCCPAIWPEDSLKVVKSMMVVALHISIYLNLIIGLQFTYMIPQNKYTHFILAFFSFLAGVLLLSALAIYHHALNQGQSVYFASFKIKWIVYTAYLTTAIFFTCGVLSLLQIKLFASCCPCLEIHRSARERKERKTSERQIQVISLPEQAVMPRSIVRMHSVSSKEDAPDKPPVQTRRVTWAL